MRLTAMPATGRTGVGRHIYPAPPMVTGIANAWMDSIPWLFYRAGCTRCYWKDSFRRLISPELHSIVGQLSGEGCEQTGLAIKLHSIWLAQEVDRFDRPPKDIQTAEVELTT